jgi:hypothetical protein
MLALARSGDRSVLPELRAFLDSPGVADRYGGNLAWDAMFELIFHYSGKDLVVREALTQKLFDLQAVLLEEYDNPTMAEHLLIDRVVATWLHLHHLEMCYASLTEPELSKCLFYEKAISAAQHRHFAALEHLGRQREAVMPPVQLNVASEQINVAGNVSAPRAPTETPAPLG